MMTSRIPATWLSECLTRIRGARVGVFGDFRLDAHWWVESDGSCSRVREQVYCPGGAGNIATNLAVLGANAVHTVGLVGEDMFGRHLVELMQGYQVRTDAMMRIQRDWQTESLAVQHPLTGESVALEFGSYNAIAEATLDRMAEALDRMAGWCDVIVVHQFAPEGVCTAAMVHRVNAVITRNARCRFIVDARHRALQFDGAMLKLSVAEAAGYCGRDLPAAADEAETARACAASIFQRTGKTVFVSQGQRGLLVGDGAGLHESPLAPVPGAPEPVTGGDTVAAAVAAVLAGGGDALSAARLANLACRVILHKSKPPATASPQEIRQVLAEVNK